MSRLCSIHSSYHKYMVTKSIEWEFCVRKKNSANRICMILMCIHSTVVSCFSATTSRIQYKWNKKKKRNDLPTCVRRYADRYEWKFAGILIMWFWSQIFFTNFLWTRKVWIVTKKKGYLSIQHQQQQQKNKINQNWYRCV